MSPQTDGLESCDKLCSSNLLIKKLHMWKRHYFARNPGDTVNFERPPNQRSQRMFNGIDPSTTFSSIGPTHHRQGHSYPNMITATYLLIKYCKLLSFSFWQLFGNPTFAKSPFWPPSHWVLTCASVHQSKRPNNTTDVNHQWFAPHVGCQRIPMRSNKAPMLVALARTTLQ